MKSYYNFIYENKVINVNKQGNFVMFIGGPGSGKSEISKTLINIDNPVYFNVDSEREMISKKLNLDLSDPENNNKILDYTHKSSDSRNRTIKLLKSLLSSERKFLPNIIFDTVGNHLDLIKELINMAILAGYKTTLVFVKTDISIALKRNKKRNRILSDDVVIKYHNLILKSFDILFPLFDDVWIVDNNDILNLVNRQNIAHKIK